MKKKRKTGDCPNCQKRCNRVEFSYERTIRDLDCVEKTTYITFSEYKIKCRCGYRGLEKLEFIEKFSFFTRRFEEYLHKLCSLMSIKDAAKLAKVNWKSAKNIDKKYLRNQISDFSDIDIRKIGIDEIAYQKGHNYLTVVRDLGLGTVIWIGEGRRKESLDEFFLLLGKDRSELIEVAVMDMWDPFIASVKDCASNAEIVFDKFHFSKKVNEALDQVRKQEFKGAKKEVKKDMKNKRFLILSRNSNLQPNQKETIENLKKINNTLYEAYLLKEQVLDIFYETDLLRASGRFLKWVANVRVAGISTFEKVISVMKQYLYGILNYFRYRLTNAASEGFNNKINIIKRRAYGFRDLEYFKLKILQSCGWKSS